MQSKQGIVNDVALEHQRKLWAYFNSKEWPVLQEELRQYRADLVRYMSVLDVSNDGNKIEHIRSKAQLELVDVWLQLPVENKSFLEQFKDLFVGLFN